jgi:hypothetical protein
MAPGSLSLKAAAKRIVEAGAHRTLSTPVRASGLAIDLKGQSETYSFQYFVNNVLPTILSSTQLYH